MSNAAVQSTGGITMDDSAPIQDDRPLVSQSTYDSMPESLRSQADQEDFKDTSGQPLPGGTKQAAGHVIDAYVNGKDPNTVNIQDPSDLHDEGTTGEAARLGHETMHALQYNQPPTVQAKVPEDSADVGQKYDLSDLADLRKQGKTINDIPMEKSGKLVEEYIRSNGTRTDLKPWIQDIKNIKGSTIMPTTSKNPDGSINTTARAPKGGQEQLEELSSKDVHNPPPAPKGASKPAPAAAKQGGSVVKTSPSVYNRASKVMSGGTKKS